MTDRRARFLAIEASFELLGSSKAPSNPELDAAYRRGFYAGSANMHWAPGMYWASSEEITAWRDGWRVGFAAYQDRDSQERPARAVAQRPRPSPKYKFVVQAPAVRRQQYLLAKS